MRLPRCIVVGRYATVWEIKIGWLWAGVYRRQFRAIAGFGFIRIVP